MRKIENLIIHHSDSEFGSREIIKAWHLDRGFLDIGYNAIICNGYHEISKVYDHFYDGYLEEGRALDFSRYVEEDEVAAHTLGYNSNSIGVCMIGRSLFSEKQFAVLAAFCDLFKAINPDITIIGHYEARSASTVCPGFNMSNFREYMSETVRGNGTLLKHLRKWVKST